MKGIVLFIVLFVVVLAASAVMATEVRVEGNNLVYYEKTKEIPNVPKGITAEQARQVVEGEIPKVSLLKEKIGTYFGFPITGIKTETTVLFRNGWLAEEESRESLSVFGLFGIVSILFYGFWAAYADYRALFFFLVFVILFLAVEVVLSEDRGRLAEVGALAILLFSGYAAGPHLSRRNEKRLNAVLLTK